VDEDVGELAASAETERTDALAAPRTAHGKRRVRIVRRARCAPQIGGQRVDACPLPHFGDEPPSTGPENFVARNERCRVGSRCCGGCSEDEDLAATAHL